MINDNDLLLMLSESLQNNGTYKVYIDSNGYKTLTPQTRNYTATYEEPYICNNEYSVGLLYDKNPKKVVFPNCSEATGAVDSKYSYVYSGAFEFTFNDCTSLTSVSFPSLTSVSSNAFNVAFNNCSSSLKVHFKKSMKGTTGLDYKTMGLTSADQVVFDLP